LPFYIQIDGYIENPENIPYNSRIYIKINNGEICEAFPATIVKEGTGHAWGFRVYISSENHADLNGSTIYVYAGSSQM